MIEKVMDRIIWFLLMVGAALTIEEAISVAYVGLQADKLVCNVALGCLIGSVGVLFIGGIILSIKEAVEALVK